jgi:hypothetical protein
MANLQEHRSQTLRDLLRLTTDVPFLAACTVPLSDAQIRILNETETFATQWFARRRKAVKANCDIIHSLANHGYSDPLETSACMVQLSLGGATRVAEDIKDASQIWMKCWLDLARGLTSAGLVNAKAAQAVAPMQPGNHSTPL